MNNNVMVIDNVMSEEMLHYCYNKLTSMNIWNLRMSASPESEFSIVGASVYERDENFVISHDMEILTSMIFLMIKEKADFLTTNIERIHIGAKAAYQDDVMHTDSDNDSWTILFYSNPVWKPEWGGETIVGDEIIEYKPNRALIYDARILHGGKAPTCPHLRTYVNFVVNR